MAIEKLLELFKGLPDGTTDETKTAIKALFQEVTKEAGKAKSDLEQYKDGDGKYKKLYKKFQDNGYTPDQIDEILSEMGVKKSQGEELEVYKRLASDYEKKVKDSEKALNLFKVEVTMKEKIKQAVADFKDKDGKPYKLVEDFINEKELTKDIDITSDVLVQDRLNKILTDAYQKQEAFMKKTGATFGGQTTHTVPIGDGQFGSGKALDLAQVRKTMNEGGNDVNAAARALQLAMEAARPN